LATVTVGITTLFVFEHFAAAAGIGACGAGSRWDCFGGDAECKNTKIKIVFSSKYPLVM